MDEFYCMKVLKILKAKRRQWLTELKNVKRPKTKRTVHFPLEVVIKAIYDLNKDSLVVWRVAEIKME